MHERMAALIRRSIIMEKNRNVVLACLIAGLLAGCQKTPEPKTAASAPAAASGEKSVALPPNQMPLSDSAIAPKSPGGSSSGDAGGPTQATPAQLNKAQEQSAMPQSGQVNNHSVPQTTGETR